MKKLIAFVALSIFFVGVASAQVQNTSTTSEKKTECTKSKECCSKSAATQSAEKKECSATKAEGKSECCSKSAAADAKKERTKEKSVALKMLLQKVSRKRDAKRVKRKTAAKKQEINNFLFIDKVLNLG